MWKTRRRSRWVFVDAVVLSLGIAGCTSPVGSLVPSSPADPGYVSRLDDQFVLNIAAPCPALISTVTVKYDQEGKSFDELDTVWEAESLDGPLRSVTLFQEQDQLEVRTSAEEIDHSKSMVIAWSSEDETTGSIVGTLEHLTPDEVLWAKGIEDSEEFLTRENDWSWSC
jgi:hypothetical protein